MAIGGFPGGLQTKTLTFGRYTSALGTTRGGKVTVGFEKSMLHVPTAEVIVAGMQDVTVDPATGVLSIEVPITVTDDLVADWKTTSAFVNQRLTVTVGVDGYTLPPIYLDVHADDVSPIDFDQLDRYTAQSGLPVSRAAVASLAGLSGVITAQAAADALQPYIVTGTLTQDQLDAVTDDVTERVTFDLEPPVDLVIVFENSLQ